MSSADSAERPFIRRPLASLTPGFLSGGRGVDPLPLTAQYASLKRNSTRLPPRSFCGSGAGEWLLQVVLAQDFKGCRQSPGCTIRRLCWGWTDALPRWFPVCVAGWCWLWAGGLGSSPPGPLAPGLLECPYNMVAGFAHSG